MIDYAVEVVAAGRRGEDRAVVVPFEDGIVIALADGAGGTGSGDHAAQAVVAAVSRAPDVDATSLLEQLDGQLESLGAQSTAVIVRVDVAGVRGASVGDSGAWLIDAHGVVELTARQHRKPLLGSGAIVVEFGHGPTPATVLIASDGLLRYAKSQDIARIATGSDLATAAKALVDLARLPTGGLQDDVAIVLCRQRR